MEIQIKKIEELSPAPYNPRKVLQSEDKEYQDIKRNIQNFGLVVPLIVNKRTGYLVNGNQRLNVLKDLGYKEVEVNVIDVDIETEKALNVALSRIDGDFEVRSLTNVIGELQENGINPSTLGFTQAEILRMFPADMDADNLFSGEDDDNPFKEEKKYDKPDEVVCLVGKYRFKMYREQLEEIMAAIRYRNGFMKESTNREIKLRLIYGKQWKQHLTDYENTDN